MVYSRAVQKTDVKNVVEKGKEGVEYVKENAGNIVKEGEQEVVKGAEYAAKEVPTYCKRR